VGDFFDSTLNFFGIEDDPDSGIYDLWGTGLPGDYSPGGPGWTPGGGGLFGITDDPDSGIYDLWGTGKEGDYSPGIGDRWVDREYGGWSGAWDSALGWTEEVVTDVGTAAGRTTNKTFQSLTGITPVTLALLAGAGFIIYKKATK